MRAGGRGVLGVYYLLVHYYYCQSKVGEESSQGGEGFRSPPPLENTLVTIITQLDSLEVNYANLSLTRTAFEVPGRLYSIFKGIGPRYKH